MSQLQLMYNLELVNEVLKKLKIDEISKKAATNKNLIEKKIDEVGEVIRDKLKTELTVSAGDIVISQMQNKFKTLDKNDQYRVLTSMPYDSSVEFLKKTFGITDHQAKRAKVVQAEHGIMSTPAPKPGRRIPDETINKVKLFYESDQVSRQMPGKKDSVSMLVNGIKQQVQKRLILFTEYEAFLQFKECNPEVKIGFSKFAEARPKNVVLPGSAGTHNVCVCTYHQNPKLMIRNSQISSRPEFQRIAVQKGESYEGEIKYQHLVARIMCNPPSEDCWLNDCEHCEDSSRLEDELVEIFSELDIEEVSYKQWESTDRT